MVNNSNKSDIKKLLDKAGKADIKTKNGRLMLLKNDGRHSYGIRGFEIGITEKQLQDMIEKLPVNIGLIGRE